MDTEKSLSPSQKKAVEHQWRDNLCMILSTAGSGKTLVLTRRVIRIASDLVAAGDLDARLLCVCYNRNAAEEMCDRIATTLVAQNLARHIYVSRDSSTMLGMVTIEVRTFHALGFYLLKSSPSDQRHFIHLDSRPIYALTGATLRSKFFHALQVAGYLYGGDTEKGKRRYITKLLNSLAEEKGVLFDSKCSTLLQNGTFPNSPALERGEFWVYERMLSENNGVDYNDMLRKTILLLIHSQRLRSRLKLKYRSVLVDEFQDMSASQVFLCRTLVEVCNSLTFVGDDDQQIYSFRTGNGWCCHEVLKSVFSNIDTLTLDENHRCTGAVVKAAYTVINHNTNRVPKEIKAVREKGSAVEVVGCKNHQLEMEFVMRKVKKILPRARRDGERILLLFRRNNLLSEYQKRFARERIPITRKANPPRNSARIGSATLQVFALLTLLTPNVSEKLFLWAAITVSPGTDESFLEDILNEKLCGDQSVPESNEHGRQEEKRDHLLDRVRSWYRNKIQKTHDEGSSTHGENSSELEMLQSMLSVVDAVEIHAKAAKGIEEVVQYAAKLLSNPADVSETLLSSQNALSQESERQTAPSYGFKDDIDSSNDMEGFEVLVSVANAIDEKENRYILELSEEDDESRGNEENARDSDDEDFAELFSRDRHMKTTKKRRTEGLKGKTVQESDRFILWENVQQKLEELRATTEEKFKKMDKKSLESNAYGWATTVLSTAHGAKGCTFSYVILCGADCDAFPVGGRCVMTMNPMDNGMVQEERRLFFVALTRTMRHFTCTYSSLGVGSSMKESQSPFVSEMLNGLEWDPQYVNERFVYSPIDIEKMMEPQMIPKEEANPSEKVEQAELVESYFVE